MYDARITSRLSLLNAYEKGEITYVQLNDALEKTQTRRAPE